MTLWGLLLGLNEEELDNINKYETNKLKLNDGNNVFLLIFNDTKQRNDCFENLIEPHLQFSEFSDTDKQHDISNRHYITKKSSEKLTFMRNVFAAAAGTGALKYATASLNSFFYPEYFQSSNKFHSRVVQEMLETDKKTHLME